MGQEMTSPLSLTSTRAFMTDLANAGVFEAISGLVIGRPFAYNEKMRRRLKTSVVKPTFQFFSMLALDMLHLISLFL